MSRHNVIACLTAAILLAIGTSLQAADADKGKSLHDEHCMRCHDSSVYTRSDRLISSLPALETQVRRCDNALGTTWFDEEISDVVQYLNQSYYKF